MSGYSENEREWAVVDRMAKLLAERPKSSFDVTLTYALFSSVLCWVLERIRTHGIGFGLAKIFCDEMKKLDRRLDANKTTLLREAA